jgi:hypothetical protein
LANSRGIVITSFGPARDTAGLIRNVCKYTDLPVMVVGAEQVKPLWSGHPRWGVRNSNLAKYYAVMEAGFDSVCVLDDDMRIVNKSFIEGFALAEKFGLCLPMSPRHYVSISAMIGADVSDGDRAEVRGWPQYATECNTSPMFACRAKCAPFMEVYKEELTQRTCRGTMALWKAAWKSGQHPYILSYLWCVCRDHARAMYCNQGRTELKPIMLHIGHNDVKAWYERAFQ